MKLTVNPIRSGDFGNPLTHDASSTAPPVGSVYDGDSWLGYSIKHDLTEGSQDCVYNLIDHGVWSTLCIALIDHECQDHVIDVVHGLVIDTTAVRCQHQLLLGCWAVEPCLNY